MLSLLYRQLNPRITWQRRFLTQGLLQSSSTPPPSLLSSSPSASKNLQEKPYYVPRNSKGNLPVYSDIRNAGSRPLVHIRNVEGDISTLAKELSQSLFPKDSHEASKLKIRVNFGKHLVITGGRWKNNVADWLKTKGF